GPISLIKLHDYDSNHENAELVPGCRRGAKPRDCQPQCLWTAILRGRNTGREINARAEGDTFTALLTVKTNGHRQVFLMESPGAKVSQVSINLSQAAQVIAS